MDIKTQLYLENTKDNVQNIVNYIGQNEERFDELMQLFLYDEVRIIQRASWVLGHFADTYPDMVKPHLPQLLEHLYTPKHNAVRRNILRILQHVEIPEESLGSVVDICFRFLNDPQEAIAIRVFSMTVLYNAALREPDLFPELIDTITPHLEHGSAGFKSRGKKILKAAYQRFKPSQFK